MNKNVYILYVSFTNEVTDEYERRNIGYFESPELAEEAMAAMTPDMDKRREELLIEQHKLFGEGIKYLAKLYSDEFFLGIEERPMNVAIQEKLPPKVWWK